MGIIVPLVLILITGAVWGKTYPAARLNVICVALFAAWAMLAVANQQAAITVASGVASGISEFVHSAGLLITHLGASSKR